HGLRACGIGKGDRVALLGPSNPQWIVAYFAIVTAGAIAVPLDPQGTTESAAAALARAAPEAIITTRAQRDSLVRLVDPTLRFWLVDAAGDDSVAALGASGERSELPSIGGADL